MQPTGQKGAGRRAGGALLECRYGSVGLCGHGHDGPQLMRKSLGGRQPCLPGQIGALALDSRLTA
jgi:hypothetical protein